MAFACQQEEKPTLQQEIIEQKTEVVEEVIQPDSTVVETKPDTQTEVVNVVSVETKDNVVEFHQSFASNDENNLSEVNDLDLSNTSGAMISAYSLDVSDYEVFFRIQENGEFGEWIQMKENDHVQNPNRKVWNATPLNDLVEKIQFKSTAPTNSEVVFRVFKFAKK